MLETTRFSHERPQGASSNGGSELTTPSKSPVGGEVSKVNVRRRLNTNEEDRRCDPQQTSAGREGQHQLNAHVGH